MEIHCWGWVGMEAVVGLEVTTISQQHVIISWARGSGGQQAVRHLFGQSLSQLWDKTEFNISFPHAHPPHTLQEQAEHQTWSSSKRRSVGRQGRS